MTFDLVCYDAGGNVGMVAFNVENPDDPAWNLPGTTQFRIEHDPVGTDPANNPAGGVAYMIAQAAAQGVVIQQYQPPPDPDPGLGTATVTLGV